MRSEQKDSLLTPAEVAALFRVDPKTVTRWAKAGKISVVRTLGGHRRFRRADVEARLRVAIEGEVEAQFRQDVADALVAASHVDPAPTLVDGRTR